MIEVIGSLFSGLMSGGVTGLIGLGIKAFEEANKRRHDLEMARLAGELAREARVAEQTHELAMAQQSAASAERMAMMQAEARANELASSDMQASFQHDRATYFDGAKFFSREAQKRWYVTAVMAFIGLLMGLVDFLRGIVRPGITAYSMGLLTMLLAWVQHLWAQHQIELAPDRQAALVMEIVQTATSLITTVTIWWFGARGGGKK